MQGLRGALTLSVPPLKIVSWLRCMTKYNLENVSPDHNNDLSLSQILYDEVNNYDLYAHGRLESYFPRV